MKVPLAGPHENLAGQKGEGAQGSPADQTIFTSQGNLSAPIQPTKRIDIPPPLPPEKPFVLRMLPLFLGLLVVGILVFTAIRFLPGLFGAIFQKGGGNVELTYWGLWEEEQTLAPIIGDYERDHPNIKITYQKQSLKQYRETLTNRLSGADGPDMFRFHNTWVPMLRDFLVPVPGNIYSKGEFDQTFYKVAREDLAVGNSYIGIPLEIDTLALFINVDDFTASGHTPPKTWQELRSILPDITVKDANGRIQKAGIALGTFDNVDHASDILALMMMQAGVDFKKIDKSLSQKGDNLGQDVLDFYVNKFASGDNKVWDDTLDPSTLAFAKEKLAMYFGYSWRIFEIRSLNPTLKFKVVPVPQLPTSNSAFASYWVEGVSKKSKHPKEAFAFLKYLSSAEVMQKLYSEEGKLRQFGEPYSRVDLADKLKGTDVEAFVAQAPIASSWYLASNTFDNGVNDQMIKYIADAIRAVGSGVSPKTALETVAKGIDQVATQYGL